MTLHAWWLFVVTVFLLSATPGPTMLHIVSCSVQLGMRRATMAVLGCVSALFLVLVTSAVGLTASLLAVPGAFATLRFAGVTYLFYLGVKAFCSGGGSIVVDFDGPVDSPTSLRVLGQGFMTAVSNPKLLLFAVAFFPQFVNPDMPQAPQYAVLVTTDVAMELFWCLVYASGGQLISGYLVRPSVKYAFNCASGCLFIALGVVLIFLK